MPLPEVDIKLDPAWKIVRRFTCGHMQHACCPAHLDKKCPICFPRTS